MQIYFEIGLDPAGPAFTNVDPSERLDRNDALFVDVIHTDMSSTVLTGIIYDKNSR